MRIDQQPNLLDIRYWLHRKVMVRKKPLDSISRLPRLAGKTWYLPHHGVEQNGMLRVVFSASARSQEYSLNNYLLQGPDLLTLLFRVLIRFWGRAHAKRDVQVKRFSMLRNLYLPWIIFQVQKTKTNNKQTYHDRSSIASKY